MTYLLVKSSPPTLLSKEKSAVYNILAFNFDGEKTTKETVKEIKKSGALDGQAIVAESIVSVNEKGRFTFTSRGMASWVAPLVLLRFKLDWYAVEAVTLV